MDISSALWAYDTNVIIHFVHLPEKGSHWQRCKKAMLYANASCPPAVLSFGLTLRKICLGCWLCQFLVCVFTKLAQLSSVNWNIVGFTHLWGQKSALVLIFMFLCMSAHWRVLDIFFSNSQVIGEQFPRKSFNPNFLLE